MIGFAKMKEIFYLILKNNIFFVKSQYSIRDGVLNNVKKYLMNFN